MHKLLLTGVLMACACACTRSGARRNGDGGGAGGWVMGSAGKGGNAASVPGIIANPQLRDACALSGKLGPVVNGVCPTRVDTWEWDMDMAWLGATADQSSLPSCPMAAEQDLIGLDTPGWLLRIDRVFPPVLAGQTTDHFHSVVIATRTDGPTPCAVRLIWKLKQFAVALAPGRVVRFSRRTTIRSVEDDVTVTAVLRDDKGAFLVGYTSGARPEVWDQDMWPELTLAIEPAIVCSESQFPGVQRLRFTLSSGADRCTIEAASARCCAFAGKVHVVMSSDAVRNTTKATVSAAGTPIDNVTVVVAAPDMLTPIP